MPPASLPQQANAFARLEKLPIEFTVHRVFHHFGGDRDFSRTALRPTPGGNVVELSRTA
jgi:hypothetical protein